MLTASIWACHRVGLRGLDDAKTKEGEETSNSRVVSIATAFAVVDTAQGELAMLQARRGSNDKHDHRSFERHGGGCMREGKEEMLRQSQGAETAVMTMR